MVKPRGKKMNSNNFLEFPILSSWINAGPSLLSVNIYADDIVFKLQSINVICRTFNCVVGVNHTISQINFNLVTTRLVT